MRSECGNRAVCRDRKSEVRGRPSTLSLNVERFSFSASNHVRADPKDALAWRTKLRISELAARVKLTLSQRGVRYES
jgi:hypothetical protein